MKKDIKKKIFSRRMKLKLKVDPDTIMTPRDIKDLKKAEKELRMGKTTPLSKLKEELGWGDDS